MAISLRPETKRELVKLLEVYRAFDDAREKYLAYPSEYSYETQENEGGYHSNNVFPRKRLTAEGWKRKEEKKALGKKWEECEDAYDRQLEVVGKTFTREYGLNDARATVEEVKPEGKKLYHSAGVNSHDIRKICTALAEGGMHPGRFTSNAAGIATYFGNLPFFEQMRGDDFAPEKIIEATLSEDAKIHEISVDDYVDCNLEEYEPLFNPEDYKLLCDLERCDAMHVRSIFDVALGYDACVRRKPSTDVEIWAIYKRDILKLSKSPIIKFHDVVTEPDSDN